MSIKKTVMYFHCLFILTTLGCNKQNIISLNNNEFSIEYPAHLELVENEEGTIFILKTKQKDESDIFIENINLTTKKTENVDFNEFASRTEKEVNSFAEIVESKRLKLNDKDCLRLVFKLTQNNVKLTFIQHLFVENGKIYALTFSGETKEFKNYFDEMNKVLMSFKIK